MNSNMTVSTVLLADSDPRASAATLESILAQSRMPEEVLLVGPGAALAADTGAARAANGIVAVRDDHGRRGWRNAGLAAATGRWMAFAHAGDLWLPDRLQRQLAALTDVWQAAGVCFCDVERSGDNGAATLWQAAGFAPQRATGIVTDRTPLLLAPVPALTLRAAIVRRDLALRVGGFDEADAHSCDRDFILRVAREPACYVSAALVRFPDAQLPARVRSRARSEEVASEIRAWRRVLPVFRKVDPRFAGGVEARLAALLDEQARLDLDSGDWLGAAGALVESAALAPCALRRARRLVALHCPSMLKLAGAGRRRRRAARARAILTPDPPPRRAATGVE